jgi:cell division protein FtsL
MKIKKKIEVPSFNQQSQPLKPLDCLLYTLSIALFIVAVLTYVFPSVQMVNLTYEYEELRRLKAQSEETRDRLKIEYASKLSLSRFEEAARTRLGMAEPEPGQIVFMKFQSEPPDKEKK